MVSSLFGETETEEKDLNGVKMHENKEYIMKLKDEMGFTGFIASDWESVQHIPGASYRDQIITAVNAGIDMLMEVERFEEAKQIITDAVTSGEISETRVDDAVTRIVKVKKGSPMYYADAPGASPVSRV